MDYNVQSLDLLDTEHSLVDQNGHGDVELVEFRPRLHRVNDHSTTKFSSAHAGGIQPGGDAQRFGRLTNMYHKFRRAPGLLASQRSAAGASGPEKRVQFLSVYKVCGIVSL